MPNFYFLHIQSGRVWPTDDPQQWLLNYLDDDLLAPARERLMLCHDDPARRLQAVLRRCGLALVRAVNKEHLVVRHWSGPTPDLRRWAKDAGWNRPGVQVVVVQEKTGKVAVHQDGQDVLLHGESVGLTFPWVVYATKYERRLAEECDDGDAAPVSVTNFEWEGSPPERLGWRVLKSIWFTERIACPNCDVPLLIIGFDWRMGMMSFRPHGSLVSACGAGGGSRSRRRGRWRGWRASSRHHFCRRNCDSGQRSRLTGLGCR